jgi:D-3-phosphoglycerate dehydrogenase
MQRFKVALVASDMPPTPDWVGRQLDERGIDFIERACTSPAELVETAGEADAVWVMGGSRVLQPEVLPYLRRCRLILRTGTGTDNIPVDAATRLGILVGNTPEATMHQVAEHAIGLLFAVIRRIAVQDRLVRLGIWDRHRAWPDWHLAGQTLGLIGFGRIARLLARKASALELTMIACDPLVDATLMQEHGVEKVGLDDLLVRSDFVSIHVPLSAQTTHLLGERELRLMRPRAVLINTARGPLIDQPALVRALSEGWIAAAGLDVLETEPPPPDDPLLKLDNVVLTPHIAGYSDLFYENFWNQSIETLIAMVQTGRPIWVVNAEVIPGWQAARPAGDRPSP